MSKKNLDKLFQEKFKDFEEVPDEKVWDGIEASLNKNKRKQVIPMWWKLAGVAAVLALALILWNPFSDSVNNLPAITNTDNSDIKKEGQRDALQLPKTPNEAVVEKTVDERPLDAENDHEVATDAVTVSSVDKAAIDARQNQRVSNEKSSIVKNDTDSQYTDKKPEVAPISKDVNSKNIQLTATDTNKTDSDSETYENSSLKKDVLNISIDNKNGAIAGSSDNKTEETITDPATTVTKNATGISVVKNDVDSTNRNIYPKESTTFNTEEKVAQSNQNSNNADRETDPKKKSIFEAIDEQNEEEILAKVYSGRWSAGPSIAPVYFNGIGEGSPVHSNFTQNAKSGNTNLSYGLSVAYEVSSRLRVRSGLHKVDYGYDTDNVEFSSSLQAAASERIENINYAAASKNLVVKSKTNSFSNLESSNNDVAIEVSAANSSMRTGTMSQQFGYLEVPLELDYALIDRKFGVNLVGGISSLFLLDNLVLLTSGDLTTEIGEANNVNNINFSTNIGFGVNYKFTPKIQLNIEPVFKYQLNTFSEVSGDFQPFSVGVYSGLNFKF